LSYTFKFHLEASWSYETTAPEISMKHRASSTHRMDAPDRQNGQMDVSLSVRLLDGVYDTVSDVHCTTLSGLHCAMTQLQSFKVSSYFFI